MTILRLCLVREKVIPFSTFVYPCGKNFDPYLKFYEEHVLIEDDVKFYQLNSAINLRYTRFPRSCV